MVIIVDSVIVNASREYDEKSNNKKLIGILGGLGPLAHIDFEKKLLDTASTMQLCYPSWVLSSLPNTPDRTEFILGTGADPRAALRTSIGYLKTAGANFICSPCNTAHFFLPALVDEFSLPLESIITQTVKTVF